MSSMTGGASEQARSVNRRKKAGEAPAGMKALGDGLFWDEKSKGIYRQAAGKLTLYSRDRRKAAGSHPAGGGTPQEREIVLT